MAQRMRAKAVQGTNSKGDEAAQRSETAVLPRALRTSMDADFDQQSPAETICECLDRASQSCEAAHSSLIAT